jgi:Protein of unknown function (DUF2511)
MPFEEVIKAQPLPIGLVRRRFRMSLANLAIALGWALKHSCKRCAQRLFIIARWLAPQAERFFVLRTGSSHQRRRITPVILVCICGLIFGLVSGLIVFPDRPRQGIEITQNEYGKRWPFAAPQGQLRCEGRGAIILTVRGVDYAVNGMAANRSASIQAIWKKGEDATDIGPIISRGLTLCKW